MRTLANSDHGSTYLRAISVKKHQWQFEEQSVNWDPALLAQRLALIAASIDNIVAFLNFANGLPLQDVTFEAFDEATVEAVMTQHHLGTVHAVRMNHLNIDPAWLPNLKPEEILTEAYPPLMPNEGEPERSHLIDRAAHPEESVAETDSSK